MFVVGSAGFIIIITIIIINIVIIIIIIIIIVDGRIRGLWIRGGGGGVDGMICPICYIDKNKYDCPNLTGQSPHPHPHPRLPATLCLPQSFLQHGFNVRQFRQFAGSEGLIVG